MKIFDGCLAQDEKDKMDLKALRLLIEAEMEKRNKHLNAVRRERQWSATNYAMQAQSQAYKAIFSK